MIAFVRSPAIADAAEQSRFQVSGSMSAKRAVAPRYSAQFVEAANVIGEPMTSSPGPTPAANAAPCRAAVPLEKATQCFAPTRSAIASSKRAIVGPCVMNGSRSAAVTASMSASVISWRA